MRTHTVRASREGAGTAFENSLGPLRIGELKVDRRDSRYVLRTLRSACVLAG